MSARDLFCSPPPVLHGALLVLASTCVFPLYHLNQAVVLPSSPLRKLSQYFRLWWRTLLCSSSAPSHQNRTQPRITAPEQDPAKNHSTHEGPGPQRSKQREEGSLKVLLGQYCSNGWTLTAWSMYWCTCHFFVRDSLPSGFANYGDILRF